MITGVVDEYPKKIGKRREKFVFVLLLTSFCCALSTTTQGGIYLVTLLEYFATGIAIMTFVLIETVAVSWFYGELHPLVSSRNFFTLVLVCV